MSSIIRLLLVPLTTALALTACGGAGDDGDAKRGDDGAITLLEQGSEPRRPLRIKADKGQQITTVLTMSMSIEMELDGQTAPFPALPDTAVTIRTSVDDVSDDGDISFSFEYTSVEPVPDPAADSAVLDALRTELKGLQGIRGTSSVSSRGEGLESSVDLRTVDDNLRPMLESLNSQMAALTVPFPADAVGEGARWQAKRRATLNGVDSDMTMSLRLESIDGQAYTLAVEQEMTAPRGAVELPGLPAGTNASIDKYLVRTSGTVDGHLGRILPLRSLVEGAGDIRMQLDAEGKQRASTLLQHLELKMTLNEP